MTQAEKEAIERRIRYHVLLKDLFERSLDYTEADKYRAKIKQLQEVLYGKHPSSN